MRRKPILILIILVALATTLCLWFEFGACQRYNRWTALRDIKDGHVQIVEVGEPSLDPLGRAKRASSFGFKIHSYGCNVLPWAMHGIDDYNEVMRGYLEGRNGKDLWKKVDDKSPEVPDTDATNLRLDQILELVESQPFVKSRDHYLDSISGGKRHLSLMTDIADSARNIYRVRVVEDNGVSYAVHHTYSVDANTMTILSDQPEGSAP
ncbi:MAG: hypothetical protein ABI373_08670 [Flavobacteriales bacterium]